MRVYYTSDTHLNSYCYSKFEYKMFIDFIVNKHFKQETKQDVIILAGDISDKVEHIVYFIKKLLDYYEYILLTHGNHELYLIGNDFDVYKGDSFSKIEHLKLELKNLDNGQERIHFFDGKDTEILNIQGKLFYGNPMWYNYGRFGDSYGLDYMKYSWQLIMNDANYIYPKIDPFDLYLEYIDVLEKVLEQRIDVLFTHIPPYTKRDDLVSAFYYFDFFDKINKYGFDRYLPKYWIVGHDHKKEIYEFGGCKVFKNPLGYNNELKEFKLEYIEV